MDQHEIRSEIIRLENGDTTYSNCEKLAVLYVVRDHMNEADPEQKNIQALPGYSYAAGAMSEFEELSRKVSFNDLLSVLDEHMEVLKAVVPKEYELIIDKLKLL